MQRSLFQSWARAEFVLTLRFYLWKYLLIVHRYTEPFRRSLWRPDRQVEWNWDSNTVSNTLDMFHKFMITCIICIVGQGDLLLCYEYWTLIRVGLSSGYEWFLVWHLVNRMWQNMNPADSITLSKSEIHQIWKCVCYRIGFKNYNEIEISAILVYGCYNTQKCTVIGDQLLTF